MNASQDILISPNSYRTINGPPPEKELTIRDLWNILLRRKAFVLASLILCVCAAMLICAISPRLYQGTGQVQVEKEGANALGLESQIGAPASEADAVEANISLQTQAQMLQSDSLALQVIKDLDLEHNEGFRTKFSVVGWLLSFVSPQGAQDPKNASLENSPARRTKMLKIFKSSLKVKPVSGTRLIDVSYLNPDPKVAAAVVNRLVECLVDHNFQARHNATHQAVGWLGTQLSDLRKQSEDLQAKVAKFQKESGVFSLGQSDMQGKDQMYTPALDRLQQATTQLAQAQSTRIMKGALYQVVKDGDPEMISGLAGSGMFGAASSGVSGSLSLIQSLRSQEATTEAQLSELSAKFGSGYPKLNELRARLEVTQKAIKAEGSRVAARSKNDYAVAQKVEASARQVFQEEKQQANTLNDKTIEFVIVRQEAVQSRTLYENLLKRLKEADLLAGLRSTNITLEDPARVPPKPAKPNVLLYLAISSIAGLLIGMCGALFLDATNSKIQDLAELESYIGITPVGILPDYLEGKKVLRLPRITKSENGGTASIVGPSTAEAYGRDTLTVMAEPRGAYTEALRTLRTALMRANNGPPPQVILVTSPVSGEGKSMLSANLAILLAQQRKKVLLVDGDLRTPVLHRRLHLRNEVGLTSILAGDNIRAGARGAALKLRGVPGLDIIPAGPQSVHPAEMLASEQMAELVSVWREHYDCIVIDGAPVLPVTDSLLVSSHADLTLVVARYKVTERRALERTCAMLQSQGAQKIGIVLNAINRSAGGYQSYYGYANIPQYGSEQNA